MATDWRDLGREPLNRWRGGELQAGLTLGLIHRRGVPALDPNVDRARRLRRLWGPDVGVPGGVRQGGRELIEDHGPARSKGSAASSLGRECRFAGWPGCRLLARWRCLLAGPVGARPDADDPSERQHACGDRMRRRG